MERREARETKSKEKWFQDITISEHIERTSRKKILEKLTTSIGKQVS